jgi:O-antigen ligase
MSVFMILMFLFSMTSPVYERIASFAEHFFIGGGRFDMWKLGLQLVERFPMGVGFANSSVMREFDPSLPFTHRHMHNNILNIALETGILGALAYIWWFFNFIYKGFRYLSFRAGSYAGSEENLYANLLLISLLGWQVAGLVEYNFGDGEIRLLGFVLSGFLLSILVSIPESINKGKEKASEDSCHKAG